MLQEFVFRAVDWAEGYSYRRIITGTQVEDRTSEDVNCTVHGASQCSDNTNGQQPPQSRAVVVTILWCSL